MVLANLMLNLKDMTGNFKKNSEMVQILHLEKLQILNMKSLSILMNFRQLLKDLKNQSNQEIRIFRKFITENHHSKFMEEYHRSQKYRNKLTIPTNFY